MEMCCSAAAADRLFDEGVAELDRQMVATHLMRDRPRRRTVPVTLSK